MLQLRRTPAMTAVVLSLSVLLTFLPSITEADDITQILGQHPKFSTFSNFLDDTQLAPIINSRETLTVCAVDNSGMSDLVSKNLTVDAIRNVLSLHVLLDYYDAERLQHLINGTALVTTMFQGNVSTDGISGLVKIGDLGNGTVGFSPVETDVVSSTFVGNVYQNPLNISVIQISNILRM